MILLHKSTHLFIINITTMQKSTKQTQPYSNSLKNIVAMKEIKRMQEEQNKKMAAIMSLQSEDDKNEGIRKSIKKLQQNKKKYENQIDNIVRDLLKKEKNVVQLPSLFSKSTHHNRINTEKGPLFYE